MFNTSETYLSETEKAFWEAKTSDTELCDSSVFYGTSYLEEIAEFKRVSNPKMVLILLLKAYFYVSDDLTRRIAPAIGMEESVLIGMINELRKIRFEYDEKIKNMQDRVYRQHYRCIIAQRRLRGMYEQGYSYKVKKERYAKMRKRYANMKKRFDAMNRSASNSEISEVTGFPKGTVDSCIFAIKRKDMLEKI